MVRRLQGKAEVVHGKKVLQEFRLLEVTNASGLPRWIELMCRRIGADIKVMIVARLVDAHPPENDRGMIPISANHAPHVVDRDIFPGRIAYVLPSGYLFQNEQPNLIAGIQKMPGLRIVGGADDVAFKLIPKN